MNSRIYINILYIPPELHFLTSNLMNNTDPVEKIQRSFCEKFKGFLNFLNRVRVWFLFGAQ
jgi:hypothetical protein